MCFGVGSGVLLMVIGFSFVYVELEYELCYWFGYEWVVLFSFGFSVN